MMEPMGLLFDNQKEIIERQLLKLKAGKTAWMFGYRIHPVTNKLQLHNGVDLATSLGTAIHAAWDGQVTKVWNDTVYGGGNSLIIEHETICPAKFTGYAHLQSWAEGMVVGRVVTRGDIIAYVGSTGVATGPHLHFTLRKLLFDANHIAGVANCIDPLPYLCAACGVVELPIHDVG